METWSQIFVGQKMSISSGIHNETWLKIQDLKYLFLSLISVVMYRSLYIFFILFFANHFRKYNFKHSPDQHPEFRTIKDTKICL